MRPLSLVTLLLAACSDYNLTPDKDPSEPAPDTAAPGDDGGGDDGGPDPAEECNGVDDDGDGEVDEGYPDSDGDGVKDCLDEDCVIDTPAAVEVGVDDTCVTPDIEVADPWNVQIEWQKTETGSTGVIVMPAVGNLTDDNGDGLINDLDRPDIVYTTWNENHLVALHGDGSGEIWRRPGYDGNAGVAIADVDRDGAPEVIASDTSRRVVALSAAGTVEWTSASFSWQFYPQPTVGDLEGDGDVEVVFDIAVVEGSTGATVTTLTGQASSWRAPVIADIDRDGFQEILLGEKVYGPGGTVEWQVPLNSGDSTFAAVADIDGDPGGESFWVTGTQLHVRDDNGTNLRSITLNGSSFRPGPPTVADFDGDGAVEIAIPASQQIEMFEMDGTRLWSVAVQDYSGIAGASGYDINADGAYEVLYADETQLRILDGRTGAQLYSNGSHTSATLWEYPVVADVDADGSAEIIIASNGSFWRGITVLGHAGSGWASSGPTWSLHDFAMTNINPDGSIPSPAPASWEVYNLFRARPTVDDAAVDLGVRIVDVCFAGCNDDSRVDVAVQVDNLGGVEVGAGVVVALYALDAGTETLISTLPLPAPIAGGWSSDTLVFTVQKGDVGANGFVVRVDDDGAGTSAQNECDESNNRAEWFDLPC